MGAIINKAVAWAMAIAADDVHGYDQTSRWGPDYDCSSFVIQAYTEGGLPVKDNGASYTGDMVAAFLKTGFINVTKQVNLSTGEGLIVGDVVWTNGHVEMVCSNQQLVGASANENGTATGGQTGDQTGREVRVHDYSNHPWTTVLRYPEEGSVVVPISSNSYLNEADMANNATYIWQWLGSRGWTLNAVAGLLGNCESESTINPGLWQGRNEGAVNLGLGLTQWTPASKLIAWCNERGYSYTDMDSQLMRLIWELESPDADQYYKTSTYPETFAEFVTSTKDPYYLACAFCKNYERPKDPDLNERGTQAEKWFTYLSGIPITPGGWRPKARLPLWLLVTASRRRV